MIKFLLLIVLTLAPALFAAPDSTTTRWTGSWVSSQQNIEAKALPPPPGLAGNTLRQIIQPSLSGKKLRLTLSNLFGESPLVVTTVHIARSLGGSKIDVRSDRSVTFNRLPALTLQPGLSAVSDAVDFEVTALENLAVSIQFGELPQQVTGHPGSRTTSFIEPGVAAVAPDFVAPIKTEHWFFLTELDVAGERDAAAIIVLGDSITDGHGATTNQNNRWPNLFSRRLLAHSSTQHLAVLNQGIGGNRLLRDGLGPAALARFDRDVLAPAGTRYLIVFEGVNDLGTAAVAKKEGRSGATSSDMIAAYRQLIARAHDHGLRAYGATITPLQGFALYDTQEAESARQVVNAWIRNAHEFDGVLDFDAALRDPQRPARLVAAADSWDHLHPNPTGYQMMVDAIDLKLFTDSADPRP